MLPAMMERPASACAVVLLMCLRLLERVEGRGPYGGTVGEGGLEDGLRFGEFGTGDFETRCADGSGTGAGFSLDPLDELDKLGHGVHAEQRKEPAVEGEGFFVLACAGEIEELDGLSREGVDEAGDPADGSGVDAF